MSGFVKVSLTLPVDVVARANELAAREARSLSGQVAFSLTQQLFSEEERRAAFNDAVVKILHKEAA